MAGLGYANVELSGDYYGSSVSTDASAFAWQIGAGAGIKAGEKVTVDLGYRYFQVGEMEFSHINASPASSKVMLGLRFLFD